jgi:hypothetical protein
MIKFRTKSGSIYQIDYEGMTVRRISGTKPPTDSFTPDGSWHRFAYATLVDVGYPMIIQWKADSEKHSITTKVKEIL